MLNRRRTSQQGAALISALLMMALAVTLVTFLLFGQRLLIRQATWVTNADHMTLALQGVQDWAMQTVVTQKNIRKLSSYQMNARGLKVSGMIYAEGGRFNVNSLLDSGNLLKFVSLVRTVMPTLPVSEALRLSYALTRWISAVRDSDRYYLSQKPPYREAHRLMVHLSELRLVRGVTPAIYAALVQGSQRYLTVLPHAVNRINVNYASAAVFSAGTGLSMDQVHRLIHCRETVSFFTTVDDFIQRCASGIAFDSAMLTTDNAFYLVKGLAQKGDQHLSMQGLIEVVIEKDKPVARLLWQEFNSE